MKADPNLPQRIITRHSSNQGSVVTLDMYGRTVHLFVADAKYRANKKWGNFEAIIHGMGNFPDDVKFINPFDTFDSENVCLSFSLTDAQLQERFPTLKSDKTAKENTDILMGCDGTDAAHHCRSVDIHRFGRLNLPNLYELMVIYLESDRLDELDPTLNSYPQYALGSRNSCGRFAFNAVGYVWSSTKCNAHSVRYVFYNGHAGGKYSKEYIGGVIPVLELSVSPYCVPMQWVR